jgi:hypothetical protein
MIVIFFKKVASQVYIPSLTIVLNLRKEKAANGKEVPFP